MSNDISYTAHGGSMAIDRMGACLPWCKLGCTDDSERFWEHSLEPRMCMQIYGGHKTCFILSNDGCDVMLTHMIERGACGSVKQIPRGVRRFMHPSLSKLILTHPSVINALSSVNCITNSSSSIVQVSLVECCRGINNTVTTYFPP